MRRRSARRSLPLAARTSSPRRKTRPESGSTKRIMHLESVLFPLPEPPARPRISPSEMSRDTPSTPPLTQPPPGPPRQAKDHALRNVQGHTVNGTMTPACAACRPPAPKDKVLRQVLNSQNRAVELGHVTPPITSGSGIGSTDVGSNGQAD